MADRDTEPHVAGRGASTGTGPEGPKDEDSQGRDLWTRSPDEGTKVGRDRRERSAARQVGRGHRPPPHGAPESGPERRRGRAGRIRTMEDELIRRFELAPERHT